MLDLSYQFSIRKSAILEINEITPRQKIDCIYCQRGDGKICDQGTSEDATEVLWRQEIDQDEGLH